MVDIVGKWGLGKNQGIIHIPCGTIAQLYPLVPRYKVKIKLYCDNCSAVVPKSIVAYFILTHPTRQWHAIELDQYEPSSGDEGAL